jgi:hypothetical protein
MATAQRVAGVVVLLAESAVFVWALFMSFLLTAWMEGDGFAARATELDWWIEAGKRMTVATIGAGIFALVAFFVSRCAFRWAGITSDRLALLTAAGAFVLLIGAAVVGAVTFVVTKPFILGGLTARCTATLIQRRYARRAVRVIANVRQR